MKRNLLVKLLVMLLLVSMVLVGCGKQDGGSRPKKTPENVQPVSGKYSEFIGFEYKKPIEFGGYDRIDEYGELLDVEAGSLLFYDKEKDYLNNVTETYTLYSVEKEEVVLTLTNTYVDSNYGEISWDLLDYLEERFGDFYDYEDDYAKRPETELRVEIVREDGLVYLKAENITNDAIPAEEIMENDYYTAYRTSCVTAYYDLAGTEIAQTPLVGFPYIIGVNNYETVCKALFFNTVVVFDMETWTVKESYDAAETSKLHIFDYEDEYYGYELPVSLMGSAMAKGSGPLGLGGGTVRIYDKKSGEVLFSYTCDSEALMTMANVLNNGDVLLQSLTVVEAGGEYDLNLAGMSVNVKSELLDIDTFAVKTVDVDYFFRQVISKSAYAMMSRMMMSDLDDVMPKFTDNFFNLGIALPLADGSSVDSEDSAVYVFMDSALNVQKVFKSEAEISYYPSADTEPEALLPNGDMVFAVSSPEGAKSIVVSPLGELRYYLPADAVIVGDYIITSRAIYDLSMKEISKHSIGSDETIVGMVGKQIYTERIMTSIDPETGDPIVKHQVKCYRLDTHEVYNEETEKYDEVLELYSNGSYENCSVARNNHDDYMLKNGSYIVLERYDTSKDRTYYTIEFGHTSFDSTEPVSIESAGDIWYVVYAAYGEKSVASLKPYVSYDDYNPDKGGDDK